MASIPRSHNDVDVDTQKINMKITVDSNFGRFATHAETEIEFDSENNDQLQALAEEGVESVMFRAGGSAGWKAILKHGGEHLPYEKNGKEVPAGKLTEKSKVPRNAVAYTAERAAILAEAMNQAINTEDSKLPEIVFSVTGEYVFGEKKEGAMVRAKGFIATMKAVPGGLQSIRETLAKVNPAAKDCDEEELATIVHAAMFAGK